MGNFDWSIIAGPLIGAVIGYCTNLIAVKMLFRPLREVKIGKFRVPFTPGIIPREQKRLAKKVGEAVGDTLLTEKVIEENLLTDDIKDKIREEVNTFIENLRKDDASISDKISQFTSEEDIYRNANNIKEIVTDKLYCKMLDMNLGNTVAEQVSKAVKSKLDGGILSLMITGDVIDGFLEPVSDMVDGYVRSNGRQIIADKVDTEVNLFMAKPVGDMASYIEISGIAFDEMAVKIYVDFVKSKLGHTLSYVNISKIVEDRINAMDVLEVEDLLLSVIKRELNAIVNLGALIGFVLGIIMIFV